MMKISTLMSKHSMPQAAYEEECTCKGKNLWKVCELFFYFIVLTILHMVCKPWMVLVMKLWSQAVSCSSKQAGMNARSWHLLEARQHYIHLSWWRRWQARIPHNEQKSEEIIWRQNWLFPVRSSLLHLSTSSSCIQTKLKEAQLQKRNWIFYVTVGPGDHHHHGIGAIVPHLKEAVLQWSTYVNEGRLWLSTSISACARRRHGIHLKSAIHAGFLN